jgi:5-(carboxyamino)imidazole ribonucleotide synthase
MQGIAREIAVSLDHVGVLCAEFFVDTQGTVLVNEIAPRPHNSGHLTIDAFDLSQFDLQVRATAGLPLAEPLRCGDAAMANFVGCAPGRGDAPRWPSAMTGEGVHVHDYGKAEVRPGRKMGHVTVVRPLRPVGGSEAGEPEARARILVEAVSAARTALAPRPART